VVFIVIPTTFVCKNRYWLCRKA